MLDPRQMVYSVKGVAVIPLVESRARDMLKALRVRNHNRGRPSLVPPEVLASITGSLEDTSLNGSEETGSDTPPRVKFATEDQVKIMTPVTADGFEQPEADAVVDPSRSPSPSPSTVSTPSSEMSVHTGSVAKALADRLSFWNRMSKPKMDQFSFGRAVAREDAANIGGHKPTSSKDGISLDAIIKKGDEEPAEVLNTILAASAPPPRTVDQKNSELEEKIIRECVSQFTRGGMFFAYTFGEHRSWSFGPTVLNHAP